MRIRQIISALVLFSVLCCGTVFAEVGTEETANFVLQSVSDPTVSSIGGEWAVMGISRSGIEVSSSYYSEYLNRVYAALDSAGGDLGRKYTEYSRIALSLLELGVSPYSVGSGEYNLLDYINDYDKVIVQGINGPIFSLQAKYYAKDLNSETSNKYLNYILERQNSNGSFGVSDNVPDTDITAMAIGALCLYGGDYRVDRAINRAFLYLSSVQLSDGSFSASVGSEASCESTAQVVVAMKRYGLSPNDKYFTKNGKTPIDALNNFRREGGGYVHLNSENTVNQMATEQALYALTEPQQPIKTLMYDLLWFEANSKYLESVS